MGEKNGWFSKLLMNFSFYNVHYLSNKRAKLETSRARQRNSQNIHNTPLGCPPRIYPVKTLLEKIEWKK
jgi:hypothetical protein